MSYYSILEIDKNASIDEIKKAFRKKLKKYHPDLNHTHSQPSHKDSPHESPIISLKQSRTSPQENLIKIIDAYEVLSNPIKRRRYDEGEGFLEKQIFPHSPYKKKKYFDYEQFLLARQHKFEYQVKLFLYDLVFRNGQHSIKLYEYFKTYEKISDLKKKLGFFDYFDCLFLLAEAYLQKPDTMTYHKTLYIYYEIILLEKQRPYFKSYMEEVADKIFSLLEYNLDIEKDFINTLLDKLLSTSITRQQIKKIKNFNSYMRI